MDSTPSAAPRDGALPQRDSGHRRVAALLDAAALVIEERGFEAATMSEIAARADARIGSLYRFFPSKDAIADALADRYTAFLRSAFARVAVVAAEGSPEALADVLSDLLVSMRPQTRAVAALLDSRQNWTEIRRGFRAEILHGIRMALLTCAPTLDSSLADDIAAVVLNTMKAMAGMVLEDAPSTPRAPEELRLMNRLYLRARLGPDRP